MKNRRGEGGSSQTKASPIALDSAVINRKTLITRDLMFFGALVKAYSSPVIEAKISDRAMRTYAPVCIQTFRGETWSAGHEEAR